MAGPLIDLQPLVASQKPDQLQSRLLDIFDTGLNAAAPTELTAETMAGEIDRLYPAGKDGEGAEDFLWALWTFYAGVARRVPAEDPRQQVLVKTVEKLKAREREEIKIWSEGAKVWGGLPLLGPCMREAWNARPALGGTGQDASAVAEWTSLNSFAARLLGASLQDWTIFAVWELRSALEEDIPASDVVRDSHLATACEWLAHAGKVLYDEAKKGEKLDEATARSLRVGSRLDGVESGLSQERWKFWKGRVAELGSQASDEVKRKTETVVELMKQWEEGKK